MTSELLNPDIEAAAAARRASTDAPYLAAIRGEKPSRRPVWMMRQAGRSLPEYRKVREGIAMLDSCFMPDLLAEITMQPVLRHDADAAILFSDIVVPLKAAGMDVEIVPGRGPVMGEAVRTAEQIANMPELEPEQLEPIVEGIGQILERLRKDQVLIGFAGAPFTVASYIVEGGPSKNHEVTKAMMYAQPELWHALMEKLSPIIARFLQAQIEAGVDAIQLFDSWAGFLTVRDYREFVAPYSERILAAVKPYGIPMTHFGVGTGELLVDMAKVGPDVVGVDWRVPMDVAAARVHEGLPEAPAFAYQGNLDPAVLFAGRSAIREHVQRIAREADEAIAKGHSRGHIFNLGHGVMPNTDADAITAAFEEVHNS